MYLQFVTVMNLAGIHKETEKVTKSQRKLFLWFKHYLIAISCQPIPECLVFERTAIGFFRK